MRTEDILLPSLASTSIMTTFSYIASKLHQENFNEPELLSTLPKVYLPEKGDDLALLSAWATHYGIGGIFGIGIRLFMNKNKELSRLKSHCCNSVEDVF